MFPVYVGPEQGMNDRYGSKQLDGASVDELI